MGDSIFKSILALPVIETPKSKSFLGLLKKKEKATIAGWGYKEVYVDGWPDPKVTGVRSDTLKYAESTILSNSECKREWIHLCARAKQNQGVGGTCSVSLFVIYSTTTTLYGVLQINSNYTV